MMAVYNQNTVLGVIAVTIVAKQVHPIQLSDVKVKFCFYFH